METVEDVLTRYERSLIGKIGGDTSRETKVRDFQSWHEPWSLGRPFTSYVVLYTERLSSIGYELDLASYLLSSHNEYRLAAQRRIVLKVFMIS